MNSVTKLNDIVIEFKNLIVEVGCNNEDSYRLAEMLLCDLPRVNSSSSSKSKKRYDLLSVGRQPMLSLWEGEKRVYFGESHYQLVNALVNDILFHCISENASHHALHAGAVCVGNHGIILPGASGRGKSTLTALLCQQGFSYLTDELIFLADDGKMTPFTRPFNLKTREPIVTEEFIGKYKDQLLLSDSGESMIPHRLLNKEFSTKEPTARNIIFPEYKEGVTAECVEISPAQSCFRLLQCHVNARNLPSHGIESLSNIVRKCRAFSIVYSDFDELKTVMKTSFPTLPENF